MAMSLKDKAERTAVDAAISGLLKYVSKDTPEERTEKVIKIVDLAEKIMGDSYKASTFETVRAMLNDPDNKWVVPAAGNWSITINIQDTTISFKQL